MTPRKSRMAAVLMLLAGVTLATVFGIKGCDEMKFYFFDPSQVFAGEVDTGREFRLGGMVKDGTFVRQDGALDVRFVVTDFAHDVTVVYEGLLPDLFREGQGVVATGQLNEQNEFVAHNILAKHDENYMPPEVADSLKKKPTNEVSEP